MRTASSMKERTPLRMEETDQAGTQVSGWKSDIERHSRVFVLNRPLRRKKRGEAEGTGETQRGCVCVCETEREKENVRQCQEAARSRAVAQGWA